MRILVSHTFSFDVTKSHTHLSFSISLSHLTHTFKDGKVEVLVWSTPEQNQECPRFHCITALSFICMPRIKQRWVKVSRSWGKDLDDAISSNPRYPQALPAVHWCCEVLQWYVAALNIYVARWERDLTAQCLNHWGTWEWITITYACTSSDKAFLLGDAWCDGICLSTWLK